MRTVVGVTDNAWAAYLRDRPHITEANFWMPSARAFRALSVGEPFLFKTHWPENRLVGGGFFSGFAELTVQEAWEIHGESNGVGSLGELESRIAAYRRTLPTPSRHIGCVLLRDLFFTAPSESLPAPEDFAKNIVSFKGYDLTPESPIEVRLRQLLDQSTLRLDGPESLVVPGPTHGLPRLTVPRVGQDAFKSLVLTSYHRRCAITGNKVEPVLQAGAHTAHRGIWTASGGQRPVAEVRRSYSVRSRVSRSRRATSVARLEAPARGLWERRGVLRPCGTRDLSS